MDDLNKKFAALKSTNYQIKTSELTVNVNGLTAEFPTLNAGKAKFIGIVSNLNYDPATMPRNLCPKRASPIVDKCKAECKPNPNAAWYNAQCICKGNGGITCDASCATCLGRCAF